MKTEKEIKERIEDIEKAKEDLNDRGNLSEEHLNEFNGKIDSLKWVIE